MQFTLEKNGILPKEVIRNASPSALYAYAIKFDVGACITNKGALSLKSGTKTGRSPKDKRIIENQESVKDIWWSDVNIKMDNHTFDINKQRALDYFNTRTRIYVMDGFAGWDKESQIKVRIICTRPYHALFMHNMLIRPTEQELADFGEPDYTIYNAGEFPANIHTTHMGSKTSIDLCFERGEVIILGTEYAGEMKKGIFTIMNYLMPKKNILSMHCSANEGSDGKTTLFFGLSGTGKTTLSADKKRALIGDDEHCWNDNGIFNIEGGCYAKVINLSREKEPEIFDAIKFGTVLENVKMDSKTGEVDYDSTEITENTRASYPIEFIENAKIPCVGNHPTNIVFLTCDAYGVLPPVSKLTPEQAMYHFISGYTAKMAGTEMGVIEPQATFSACFGAAFMVWHPNKYAELLAQKMREHNATAWLVNTGWIKGGYGVGERISLKHTRAIIDAINNEKLKDAQFVEENVFGLNIPNQVEGVPSEILNPSLAWSSKEMYTNQANLLANLFNKNFEKFKEGCNENIINAGPRMMVSVME